MAYLYLEFDTDHVTMRFDTRHRADSDPSHGDMVPGVQADCIRHIRAIATHPLGSLDDHEVSDDQNCTYERDTEHGHETPGRQELIHRQHSFPGTGIHTDGTWTTVADWSTTSPSFDDAIGWSRASRSRVFVTTCPISSPRRSSSGMTSARARATDCNLDRYA